MTTLDTRFDVPAHVATREVDGELVLLDLESGVYFGLDPVGARIFSLMADGKTMSEVHETLLSEFEVTSDVLERDIMDLVGELERCKLVEGTA